MSYIGAGSEEGRLVGKVVGPNSAVLPGETAKLYRVDLSDGSMGHVLAAIGSWIWSMAFLGDSPSEAYRKAQESPPPLDSDGGSLSGAGERSTQSWRCMPQLSSEGMVRSELPSNLASGYEEELNEKDSPPAGDRALPR